MLPIKKILCPTDFSEGSDEALSQAIEIAHRFEAQIYLVHVMPFQTALPTDPNFATVALEAQALHSEVERRLKKLVQRKAKGLKTRTIIAIGDAANEIVRIAGEERVDLIVIATYGKTGWRRLAFGSVAEKVVRLAPCPVLTIRNSPSTAKAA